MAREKLIVTFEIKLSDEISDEADARDSEAISASLERAMFEIATRGVLAGRKPVGNMRVTVEQEVE